MGTMLFRMNQPEALVNEIINKLPQELFTSDKTTFLDPAMGKGDFLVAIALRLRDNGHSKENILSRLHGFETNQLYINTCFAKTPLRGANIEKKTYEEVLSWEPNMKFDVIVGNPPYQSAAKANKSIYHKFIEFAIDNAVNIYLIVPATFTDSTKSIFKQLRSNLRATQQSITISTVNPAHFPTVTVKGGIVILELNPSDKSMLNIDHTLVNYGLGDEPFLADSAVNHLVKKIRANAPNGYLNVVKGTNSQRAISPHMDSSTLISHGISLVQTPEYPYPFISSVLKSGIVIAFGKKKLSYTDKRCAIITPERSKGTALSTMVDFDNINDYGLTINVLAFVVDDLGELPVLRTYLQSNIFRFLMGYDKGWTDGANIVGKMRLMPAVSLLIPWTNESLYNLFSLTEEEVALIESIIKQ